jgi:polyribonucleotide nucleotidyltransferase
MVQRVEIELGGRLLSMETGKVAKQAHGAVWLQYGETVLLVTACRSSQPDNWNFLPLTVEYREKSYAAGRIPGNFFKREGRPAEHETLSARLTDHQIRPMFPKGFPYEIQVYTTVMSADGENNPDVMGMLGASAALAISDIPFAGPLGAVRVGRVDGEWVINPTYAQLEESDVDVIVSGTADSIASVEGGAHEISESDLLAALQVGHENIKKLIDFQNELIKLVGKPKLEIELASDGANDELDDALKDMCMDRIAEANRNGDRHVRQEILDALQAQASQELAERFPDHGGSIAAAMEKLVKADMRKMILEEKRRIDGRGLTDVRSIGCERQVIPRAHGSALFTRGRTQALCTATLGDKFGERMQEDLQGKRYKSYYLDYNFPSYSVGEVRRETGPKRRDIGHGHLAEKALEPVIPTTEQFPYTLRLVSDIEESDSSSSMATVCGCSLALMDAGVPVRTAVAGAGVGLVKEGDDWELLTDIQGAEDFLGDMDLKIAGTEDGITAVQMDIKIQGISFEILEEALERAFEARLHILKNMDECISESAGEMSEFAPRIDTVKVPIDKIGAIIGPGGKTIREIEKSGASISVADDGTITIAAVEAKHADAAKAMIDSIISDAVINKVYQGTVKRIMPFGAFVEILPGKEGLVHISELAHERVNQVEDAVKEGQALEVKVLDIDNSGKIKLSHKATLPAA